MYIILEEEAGAQKASVSSLSPGEQPQNDSSHVCFPLLWALGPLDHTELWYGWEEEGQEGESSVATVVTELQHLYTRGEGHKAQAVFLNATHLSCLCLGHK